MSTPAFDEEAMEHEAAIVLAAIQEGELFNCRLIALTLYCVALLMSSHKFQFAESARN